MKKHYRLTQTSKGVPVLFVNDRIASEFGSISKKYVEQIASMRGYSLYGEICMVQGKQLFKVGKVNNSKGGVVNLLTTYSKAKFNKFVIKGM